MQRFASFREFYPFYLSEHANRASRRLHFAGSLGVFPRRSGTRSIRSPATG